MAESGRQKILSLAGEKVVEKQPLLSENDRFWAQVEPVSRHRRLQDNAGRYGPKLLTQQSRRKLLRHHIRFAPKNTSFCTTHHNVARAVKTSVCSTTLSLTKQALLWLQGLRAGVRQFISRIVSGARHGRLSRWLQRNCLVLAQLAVAESSVGQAFPSPLTPQ